MTLSDQISIFELIAAERDRQDQKWGANRSLENPVWLTILAEEVGKSAEAALKNMPTLEKELIQVAAVAVAWLEDLRTEPRLTMGWLCNCGRWYSDVFEDFRCVCGNNYHEE